MSINVATIANAIQLVSSIVSLAVQAGETWVGLQKELGILQDLVKGKELTETDQQYLMDRHAYLTEAALRPLGPRPEDAV